MLIVVSTNNKFTTNNFIIKITIFLKLTSFSSLRISCEAHSASRDIPFAITLATHSLRAIAADLWLLYTTNASTYDLFLLQLT